MIPMIYFIYMPAPRTRLQAVGKWGRGTGAVDCRRALQTQYCNIIIDSFCFVTMYGRFYLPIWDLFDIAVKTFSMFNTSMSVKGNSPQGAT